MAEKWIPTSKIEEIFPSTSSNVPFLNSNAPVAGARFEKELPKGDASIQLYSLSTPNGNKVSIILEELGIDYNAHTINIRNGDQFSSGFVAINPNSKIPALLDNEGPDGQPIALFESASILLYLADKYKRFIPSDPRLRIEAINWLFWQMSGFGPMTGNFGHFFVYAPSDKIEARNYGCARYGMEVLRLLDVLEKHLTEGNRTYLVGDEYSIADIAIFPWAYYIRIGYVNPDSQLAAKDYLTFERFVNLNKWIDLIYERPAVQKALTVCSF